MACSVVICFAVVLSLFYRNNVPQAFLSSRLLVVIRRKDWTMDSGEECIFCGTKKLKHGVCGVHTVCFRHKKSGWVFWLYSCSLCSWERWRDHVTLEERDMSSETWLPNLCADVAFKAMLDEEEIESVSRW